MTLGGGLALDRLEEKRERLAPDITPEMFRDLLTQAADLAEEHWRRLPDGRAYTRPPDEVRAAVESGELGEVGIPPQELFDELRGTAVKYPLGVGHPRWWAFMASSPHPVGIAADLVATALNNPCFATPQIAANFERVVLRWTAELCGVPQLANGLLVSGGSAANFTCLAAARGAILARVSKSGAGTNPRLIIYGSKEVHFSIHKAARLLGLGSEGVHTFGVDSEMRADVDELRAMISEDRAAGATPLAIVANAGTVVTGRIDPLGALADVAQEHDCWFHVDGAYGAFAAGLPELSHLFEGLERADSLTVDAHKWLYVPYEAAAALFRETNTLEAAFSNPASYTATEADGYYGGPPGYEHRGLQLTRAFRALKVWMILKSLGKTELRRLWRKDIAVAAEVAKLAESEPRLEVMGRSDLSCFCVRYVPENGDPDALNRQLLDRIHRDGRIFLGPTVIDGLFVLRGCILNFRTRIEDARVCVNTLLELGRAIEKESMAADS